MSLMQLPRGKAGDLRKLYRRYRALYGVLVLLCQVLWERLALCGVSLLASRGQLQEMHGVRGLM